MGPVARNLGVQALLLAALPLNAALTAAALVRGCVVRPERAVADQPRTILISGGKMTKALALARAFHAAGHRVVLVEMEKYRFTGHRFSRAVDRFHTVPAPDDDGYPEALLAIVEAEGVDVYVPVCSPVASWYDARAAELLVGRCEVLHGDAEVVARLDDKHEFSRLAASLGLPVPDAHRIEDPAEVADFAFAAHPGPYVLKSIPYDPVHRLDLTPLPRPTTAETAAFAESRPISPATPWVLQGFVEGEEYCTHTTVRDGVVRLHCCCRSSAFQINYEAVDKPEIAAWVERFVGGLGLTGQYSFDFIEGPDGDLRAIECNPRTHSAITTFHDHPGVAAAYLDDGGEAITPRPGSRPTYWLYQEVWRLLCDPRSLPERARTVWRGTDAIFAWSDPLPFLVEHHVLVPWLLLANLRAGRDFVRVDFNIGKLVEPGGD